MKTTNSTIHNDTQKFVNTVKEYADNVMERCHDRYGKKKTPLLTDGIHLKTGESMKWEKHVLSNLACQQNFLRTLDGLSMLTGETKYQKQALDWINYALDVLQEPESGLFYWGGHTSYDLLEDEPLIGNHELKCVYPYYPFLYNVAPETTRLFIEGFWNKHVKNWSNLLFNRHGEYNSWDKEAPWEHEYSGGPLPIIDNAMLSFINTGSDLVYSGALLFKLSGNSQPLLWAKRLAQRYDEIRNETTGLGGYQFNHREPCRVRVSFKKPLSERQDVNETTVITNGVIQTRYGRAALTWLNLFEELGNEDGQKFLDIVSKDLTAIGEHAYDFSDHSFSPVLTDGMKLSPDDCMEGVGYCRPQKLEKVPANGLMFFTYAKAYRLTSNKFFWQMIRSLAQGIGLGEVFDAVGEQSENLEMGSSKSSRISLTKTDSAKVAKNPVCTLFGLLELYRATEQDEYLSLAVNLGNQVVQERFVDGFFTAKREARNSYTNIDNSLPLALLHLQAIIEEKHVNLPTFYPNSTSFNPKVIIARRKRD